MADLMEMARALGKALQQDEVYLAFRRASEKNDGDLVLQDLIAQYNQKMLDRSNAEDNGEPQERIDALKREERAFYNQIMANPTMMGYLGARARFEQLLDGINRVIAMSAAGQDPDKFDPAAVAGCGGNCAGCAGCG